MDAEGVVQFRRRGRSTTGRPRKRPRSPNPGGSGDEDQGRRPIRSSGINTSERNDSARRSAPWRVEYSANGSEEAARRASSERATAARHATDEADIARERSEMCFAKITNGPEKTKNASRPLRAPAHIRTSVITDMQPDVCKDYMETGYCGFGDACKFLHDRSSAKAGWKLNKEWSEVEEERRRARARGDDPDDEKPDAEPNVDDDGLPFACHICRKSFTAPVVTLCEHYFCESCAVERMATDATCAVCKKQLRGILNTATKLEQKMKAKAAVSAS